MNIFNRVLPQCCLIFFMVMTTLSHGEENPLQGKENDSAQEFLAIEGIFMFTSVLAAELPEGFGAFMVLSSPAMWSPTASDTTNGVTVGGYALLGLYNILELKKEEYTKGHKFQKNMLALNFIYGSHWLSRKLIDDNKTRFYVAPIEDGGMLAIKHKF